jgi:hypothetical protein
VAPAGDLGAAWTWRAAGLRVALFAGPWTVPKASAGLGNVPLHAFALQFKAQQRGIQEVGVDFDRHLW